MVINKLAPRNRSENLPSYGVIDIMDNIPYKTRMIRGARRMLRKARIESKMIEKARKYEHKMDGSYKVQYHRVRLLDFLLKAQELRFLSKQENPHGN